MATPEQKRQIVIGVGAAVAIGIGVAVAMGMMNSHKDEKKMNDQPPGLVFNVSDTPAKLDPKKKLQCYVGGTYVGELTLAECAKKNGVATGALDVGLDDSGNVVAAPTGSLTPVPGAPASGTAEEGPVTGGEVVPDTGAGQGPVAACLRYSGNQWNTLSEGLTLSQCARLLYDGRCVTPGQAQYGRWGEKTLRLVPKRVEISDDNTSFRTLAEQGQGCSVR